MKDQPCELYQLHISEKLDDGTQLSAEEKLHAEQCPDCAQFVQMWSSDSLPSIAGASLPRPISHQDQIMQAVLVNDENDRAMETADSPKNILSMPWLQTAAAIVLVTAAVWLCLPHQAPEEILSENTDQPQTSQLELSERISELNDLSLKEEYRTVSNYASSAWDNVTEDVSKATLYLEDKASVLTQRLEKYNQAHDKDSRKRSGDQS